MMKTVKKIGVILMIFLAFGANAQTNVGNTNQSANTSQNANNNAANSNVTQGQMLIAIGAAMPFGTGAYLIFMGVQDLKQANAQRNSAAGAGATAMDSSYNAGKYSDNFDWNKYNGAMKQGTDYLNANGYKVNNGKVTTPNGKNFDLSQLTNNASDMAALTGMDKDQIQKALDELNRVSKDQMKKMGLDKNKLQASNSGGGGGGASGAPSGSGYGLKGLDGLFSGSKAPAKAKTEGLMKYLGDDAIGIAQDDIFKMIQRRYQEKDRAEFFSK